MNHDHYRHGECQTVDFVELVIAYLPELPCENYWHIGNALKYACRAGYKGDWREDAAKCADFLARAITGNWTEGNK